METTEKEISGFRLVKRVLAQARPFWLHIFCIFLLHLLSTPIALLKPLALKILIDSGFGNQPLPRFINFFIGAKQPFEFQTVVLVSVSLVIAVALIHQIHSFSLWLFTSSTSERMVLSLRSRLFNHTQRLSLAYHDKKGTSDALYRIQYDTTSIKSFLISNVSSLISAIVTLVAMSVVMFRINWRFTLVAFCVIPPLALLLRISSRRLRKGWRKVKEEESKAMSVANEVLSSLRIVKAFGQEEGESERFSGQAYEAVKGNIRMAWMGALFDFGVGVIFAVGTALFIYFGAQLVHQGQMTLGELTLVVAYLAQIYGPVEKISKNINDLQSSLTSLGRIFLSWKKKKK